MSQGKFLANFIVEGFLIDGVRYYYEIQYYGDKLKMNNINFKSNQQIRHYV